MKFTWKFTDGSAMVHGSSIVVCVEPNFGTLVFDINVRHTATCNIEIARSYEARTQSVRGIAAVLLVCDGPIRWNTSASAGVTVRNESSDNRKK